MFIKTTNPAFLPNCGPFFVLLFLLALNSSQLGAQIPSIKFEHLGLEHGLSQSTVYCILQDQQGFMWFGTQSGVNKFDGYNFTVYQQDVFDSTSLAQNVNNVMCEDHTGALWFGSMNAAVLNRFGSGAQAHRVVHFCRRRKCRRLF